MTSSTQPLAPADTALGIYFEVRNPDPDKASDGHVVQVIAIQAWPGSVTSEASDFRVLFRNLTTDHPKRKWRPSTSAVEYGTWGTTEEAVRAGASVVSKGIGNLLSAIWWPEPQVYGPYVIGVSDADLGNLAKNTTPRGLTDRLTRLRQTEKLPPLPGGIDDSEEE